MKEFDDEYKFGVYDGDELLEAYKSREEAQEYVMDIMSEFAVKTAPQEASTVPYPKKIVTGLSLKEQWAYTAAAMWDIYFDQVSFKKMDELEGHGSDVFNSYHFYRVVSFYENNAKKEADGERGETEAAWKQCSPAMYYAMNKLYGWTGEAKIKSGYVLDYEDPKTGKTSKGIVTLMGEKNLIGVKKTFFGADENGTASHFSNEEAVALNSSVSDWALENTHTGGVGIFLVAICGGFHSLTLIVDRRGKNVTFRLLDQHGNASTGSSSSFDRMIFHSGTEIDNYMLTMLQSWGEGQSNYNIQLFQLKRDS